MMDPEAWYLQVLLSQCQYAALQHHLVHMLNRLTDGARFESPAILITDHSSTELVSVWKQKETQAGTESDTEH
jgi:hypothetical protein